ncbi:uncharacterized protein LOC119573112 isoform X1 [Penaeus monodon]|uniref:uncharacterized protein LOC119573112 isoform X1 n=2 Tax=Penaeus monodon TaxID=6687 RepID=UPI0018A6DCCA|nr:uncharacterized protein LOC119573112 isoform X1 [Penaeus monodon]
MQLLMGWRSVRMCSVRSVSTDWRNSNPISLRKLMSDFPFDSGWIQAQAPIRMKATLARQLVDRVQRKHNTSSIAIPKAPPRLKLLTDFFGVSKSQAQRIVEGDPRLGECDTFILSRNITTLKENGLSPEEVRSHLQLLYYCPLTVQHQIAILQELGLINLKVVHFKRFKKLYKSTFQLIQNYGLLSHGYDPKWDILKPLQVPEEIIENIDFPRKIANLTLGEIHEKLSSIYLQWRLECEEEDIKRIRHIYPPTKRKSMRLQCEMFELLNNEWNINNSKVLRHGYLLSGSPHNLRLIGEQVTELAGASTKEAVALAPRLLSVPYYKLLTISKILTDLGVEPNAVLSLPQVCTLNPETIQERIATLQKVPEFEALHSHPRILRLIYYNTKIKSRLDLLHQLKDVKSMPSLNILSGDTDQFHRYITLGELKQNRRDIVTFLARSFHVKSSKIRDMLKVQLPQTTVINVKNNLHHLLAHGFTKEQVLEALDVVLYPPELVSDQLSHLAKRPEAQPYSEFKDNPNALQLLLYFIVKNSSYRL